MTRQAKTKQTETAALAKRRAAEQLPAGTLPPAGPVTTRRVSAAEARDWRPNAKPLTLTQIASRLAGGGARSKIG
jgi:hypothetical protein